jgi:hypothetical protein
MARTRIEPGAPQPRRRHLPASAWPINPFDLTAGIDRTRRRRLELDRRLARPRSLELDRPACQVVEQLPDFLAGLDLASLDLADLAGDHSREFDDDDLAELLDEAGLQVERRHLELDSELAEQVAAESGRVIRTGHVEKTREWHFCHRCHGDLQPGEPASTETIKLAGKISTRYIGLDCSGSQAGLASTCADRFGTKLFDESDGGPIDRVTGPGRAARTWGASGRPGAR